jgi:hypothetical protein
VKTVEEYADEIERFLARYHTLGRADIEMTLVACAIGAEVDDAARVEAIRRILAADEVVSARLIKALGREAL